MKKYLNQQTLIAAVAIVLGLFFMYAGGKKLFLPPAPRSGGPSTVPQEFIDLIKAFKASGYFMVMMAWFQLVSGALLLWARTRFIGALMLLPLTFNIFAVHVFLDNRIDEYIFTGVLLFANLLVIKPYFKQLFPTKPIVA